MDLTSPQVASKIRELASNMGITYVSFLGKWVYHTNPNTQLNGWNDFNTTWFIQPITVQLLQLLSDIVNEEKLQNVVLVYDNSVGK